jgi:C-terminal processing protease CtpA/Prc
LEVGQDPQIGVRWHEAVVPAFNARVRPNCDPALLPSALPTLRKVNESALAGRTDDGIGYLMLSTFAADRRREVEEGIDVLRELRGCKALVIDLRLNAGGDEALAQQLAAWFVRGTRTWGLRRTCDPAAPHGFRAAERCTITGNGPPDHFDGPVAVLTGRMTMDACESFLLMTQKAERVALVGERSYGSSGGAVPHELMPGLQVLLPASQLLRPDGSMVEGQGMAPDLEIHWPDIPTRDVVLEQALAALRAR